MEAIVGKSRLGKIRGELAAALTRPGGWVFLGIFIPFPLTGLLHAVTPPPLGDRPEFFWTWGLVVSAQLVCWAVSVFVILWDDLKAAFRESPVYFAACGVANTGMMIYATVLPLVRPEVYLGRWRVNFYDLFGQTTLSMLVSLVCLGSVVGGLIVGIAGSQFDRLAQSDKPLGFRELVAVSSRTKRSFMCLAILLTLAVFSTSRLYAAIRISDPSYTFLGEIVLSYGLLLSFLLVLFYLPVILRYHAKAQAVLEEAYKGTDLYGEDRSKLEERERMKAALGLTTLSGVESLVGALGPVLGALISLSTGK